MKALLLAVLVVVGAACASHSTVIRTPEVVVPSSSAPVVPEKRGRVVVTDTDIEILDTITFVGNTAQIAPSSTRMLDAVANTMKGNPSILLMEVRGHSDWEEPDRVVRAQLSIQRAEAVVAELVARGVNAARLQAYGASDSEPLSTTDPLVNRRIAFLIIERDSD